MIPDALHKSPNSLIHLTHLCDRVARSPITSKLLGAGNPENGTTAGSAMVIVLKGKKEIDHVMLE